MAQENWQKYKLLKLLELLRQESDEQHPLPTSAICGKLAEMGISCERRTLTKDIAVLNELGYKVMWTWVGKEKGYYIEDRSFTVPELKILIDAVQAASFITKKKTAELIDKIAELGGSHKADILKSNMVCFNTRKHGNESIYYNVGFIEDALQQRKKYPSTTSIWTKTARRFIGVSIVRISWSQWRWCLTKITTISWHTAQSTTALRITVWTKWTMWKS